MTLHEAHPSRQELKAFSLGYLADDSYAAVEAHVVSCSTCLEQVGETPSDGLVELLRSARSRLNALDIATQTQTPAPRSAMEGTVSQVQVASPRPATPGFTLLEHQAAKGSTLIEHLPPDLAGHERYQVVRLLGTGGMGAVFEAEHRVMQRRVALKFIKPEFTVSTTAVERFRREVRAAARLSHPNIVTTYDAEDAGSKLFLVMEYVEGVSLAQLVKDRGPLPIAEACEYIRQAASGLQHAHERGMVHRDVKPHNLILAESTVASAPGVVKVLDFGLAALRDEGGGELTEDNVVMGTPDYMAPEQAVDAHSADIRADIYSLGCTLYYLLTGKVPYPATTTVSKILAHREQRLPSIRRARPDVPAELARVLPRLIAKKPADRYQTPAEVAAALAPFAEPPSQTDKRGSKRGWLIAAASLFFGLVLAAGVVVYRIQTDQGELVITTESDDVEVVVKQGGKLIEIMDTKTKKKITLRSGVYELELKGGEGLKLDITHATLKRGDVTLAKIERLPKPAPPPVVAAKTPAEAKKEPTIVKEVRPFNEWRFGPLPFNPHVYFTRFSSDSRLLAAGGDDHRLKVYADVQD